MKRMWLSFAVAFGLMVGAAPAAAQTRTRRARRSSWIPQLDAHNEALIRRPR